MMVSNFSHLVSSPWGTPKLGDPGTPHLGELQNWVIQPLRVLLLAGLGEAENKSGVGSMSPLTPQMCWVSLQPLFHISPLLSLNRNQVHLQWTCRVLLVEGCCNGGDLVNHGCKCLDQAG